MAELNKQLGSRIRSASTWDDLQSVLHEHGDDLNYINVALLAARAGELCPTAAPLPRLQPSLDAISSHPQQQRLNSQQQQRQQQHSNLQQVPPEIDRIGALALERASWFQAVHFADTARGLATAGLVSRGFWRGFCVACDRKLPSLSFTQLGAVLCAVASSE